MSRRIPALLVPIALMLSTPSWARSLQCTDFKDLFRAFLQSHFAYSKLTDQIKEHTVEQFIKSLDPSKTLLLESDAQKIRADLMTGFEQIQTGKCEKLDEAGMVVVKRTQESEKVAKEFLGDSYKLDESTEIVLDPQKRKYAKDEAERDALTKKMIHFQISNYLLTDMSLSDAKKQLKKRYELATKRMAERKPDNFLVDYAEAFAQGLDPHSSYLSPDSLEDFRIQMQLSLEGIGASLTSQDGYTVVEETIPGGSADRAKVLRPKDKIIAVAQEGGSAVNVIDMDLRDVVKLIRGKKGSKVTLTVLRQKGESAERFETVIVRDKIDLKEQAAKLTFEKRKVNGANLKFAVIDLPSFYGSEREGSRSSYRDMKDLVKQAKEAKADGILLNLSRNGGGLLDDAVRISGLFIRKGGVVATKTTQKRVEVLADEDTATEFNGPLVVLTSRLSASASEILAGALKDYKRAVIVGGDHTFGKGTVQYLASLPQEMGAMKVTTGMFFVPGGKSTQHVGVSSDVVLPSIYSNDEIGEKTLDYSLPPEKIDTFVSNEANASEATQHWRVIDQALVTKLAEQSRARVSKDAKFQEVLKDVEEAAKNKGIVKLSDIRKKSQAEKNKLAKNGKKDESKSNAQKVKDADLPYMEESLNILADLAIAQAKPGMILGSEATRDKASTSDASDHN